MGFVADFRSPSSPPPPFAGSTSSRLVSGYRIGSSPSWSGTLLAYFVGCVSQADRSRIRIHGGGFVSGSSNEEKYDPSDLMTRAIAINQPIVFVSIKYVQRCLGRSASS